MLLGCLHLILTFLSSSSHDYGGGGARGHGHGDVCGHGHGCGDHGRGYDVRRFKPQYGLNAHDRGDNGRDHDDCLHDGDGL